MSMDDHIIIIKTTAEMAKLFENGVAYVDYWHKTLLTKDEVIAEYEQDRKIYNYEDEYDFEAYCLGNYRTYDDFYGNYISYHRIYPLNNNEVLLIIEYYS